MTPTFAPRVLPLAFARSLVDGSDGQAREALDAARAVDPGTIIDLIDAAGLRGRGGAGFPTGRKWRTVAANCTPLLPATVVVNAAEGEPGSFKDRAILRRDPYRVLEGALIAAHAVGADSVIVATKASFTEEVSRLQAAIEEIDRAGWTEAVPVTLFSGPGEYLYGEETALLEAIDGRPPFPRLAPPYREGVDEVFDDTQDAKSGTASAAHTELAGPTGESVAPPTLAGNTETFANIPGIVRNGADWFRALGTSESPGTVVCTITGDTVRAGVAEVELGTPLRTVLEQVGGGPRPGREWVAVMSGVANPLLLASAFDAPLSYEGMQAAGAGLGAAGFIVFDDSTDFAALAAGVARFLAVESCGQCRHCKDDGLVLAEYFARVAESRADPHDLDEIATRLSMVAEGARCNLATQQQVVLGSVLQRFPDAIAAHVAGDAPASTPALIAPVADLVDGTARLDEDQRTKQPDWTHDAVDSGQWPADRLDDRRSVRTE
jgi:NADH:ubiquinone oxidoreductase subunit F (NADH-binding)